MDLLDNIKKFRIEKGFSQEYVAGKLGIATVNYGKIERGDTKLTMERIREIKEILGVSMMDLFDIPMENELNSEINRLNSIIATQKDLIDSQKELLQLSNERASRYKQICEELETVFKIVAEELPNIKPGSDFNLVLSELRKKAFLKIQNEKPEDLK